MDRDRDYDRSYSDRDYSSRVGTSGSPTGSMSTGATGRKSGVSGRIGNTGIAGSTTRTDTSMQITGRVTTGTGTSGMGTTERMTTDMETDRTSTMGTASSNTEADIRREAHQIVQSSSSTTPGMDKTAQVDQAVDMMVMQARQGGDRIDRDAITNVLVTTGGMTRSDARATVDRWVDRLRDVRSDDLRARVTNASERAEQMAQNAANIASKAAMWAFIMMLLGLGAALWGGALGSPRDIAVISATTAAPPPPPAL